MRRILALLLAAALLAALTAAPASAQTIAWQSFPDFVDPAIGYTTEAWSITTQTHLGLVTLARGEGAAGLTLIPAAAEALPEVSPDGRTYTATLRRGLRYSNGRRVRAGDFAASIRRMRRLDSGGEAFFAGISSIRARGRTITIRLRAPNPQFPQILSMPFAALVPAGTPARNLTRHPPAGIGPFRISRVRVGRSVTLTRARALRIPGIPRPKLRTVRYVVSERPEQAGATIDPRSGVGGREVPALATSYFFLNSTTPPFDDVAVRRAVHTGLDKPALQRALGGSFRTACSLTPPELLGAPVTCPFTPDLAAAQAQIAAAGAAGVPVTVYGNDEVRALIAEFVRQLRAMGFAARAKLVDGAAYFTTIGRTATRAQAGYGNWFADYPHPGNFLFLVDPATIQATNNQNLAQVRDPAVGAAIAAGRYAEADARVIDQGYILPFGHRNLQAFDGGLGCVVVHPLYGIDASQLCRR